MTTSAGQEFAVDDPYEQIIWAKYQFFERGIGPEEFNRAKMRDIRDVMEIKKAVEEKMERERKIAEAMARMR